MAKPTRAPKVYWSEIDGLNEWIVAAPNRQAALDAFDLSQDLFAQGLAGEEKDSAKIEAARASPGAPLRRPQGSQAPFAPATTGADWSAALPKGAKAKAAKAKPKPDREALKAAEARLNQIEQEHREALAEIDADRTRLDERETREKERYDAARSEAEAARDRAAKAFGKG